MLHITLKRLKRHSAQMRTTYDLDSLASLALQVYERGLDDWQPIVASSHGDDYQIVSGHRRHMAQLLALALSDQAANQPEICITIETARTLLQTLIDLHGSTEQAVASLLEKYGDEEVAVVLFEGSPKSQILALQAANFGSDKPDMLGIAHSFRQALEAGVAVEEIARNCGQHVHYVTNHLALTQIPAELAARIATGALPMSVAATVAELPEPKRTGLAIFILANPADKLTAKELKACAAELKRWPGLQLPLTIAHQTQRNLARAMVRLWGQVVETYSQDAWAAAAMLIYRGAHQEPWADSNQLTLWFQTLGGDTYFQENQGIHWPNVLAHLLPEVTCTACPIRQLPTRPLRSDLSQGQSGVLGMPCRLGEPAERCLHGLAPDDPFDVRVPWDWHEHDGVVHEGGAYRVKSAEALLAAWYAQANGEDEEAEPSVPAPRDIGNSTSTHACPATAEVASSDETGTTPATGATNAAADSPIARQRALIGDFMSRHSGCTGTKHPMATSCGRCRHRLNRSPTKDESLPHCAWAGRLRNVEFYSWQPAQGDGPIIPVCRQFAPAERWTDLISPHPAPAGMPRDWVRAQILALVASRRSYDDRQSFEFLTGRPMSASENHGDWFKQQFEEQSGDLSDAQLWTLLVWAFSEWQRGQNSHSPFILPTNGNSAQFLAYQEVRWEQLAENEP